MTPKAAARKLDHIMSRLDLPLPEFIEFALREKLRKHLKTIRVIWHEYKNGMSGREYSIESLDERYKDAWRIWKAETQLYYQRRAIYKAVKYVSGKLQVSTSAAIKIIEARQRNMGLNLFNFSRVLRGRFHDVFPDSA